jgi:UDP-2-acetamido-3-amino-2,3-dideoxy-glucuronate N-acetyltransferase
MGDEVMIHETAVVDPDAEIGEGTRVWHFSHVMGGARIGRDCNLGQNVFVASGAVVGNGVKIQNNVSVYEGVVLEDEVFCGPSMVFTNVRTPRAHVSRRGAYETTLVRRRATLGANCTLVSGIEVGEYGFVAAGAVVTRDVAPHALVGGVPARQIGWTCSCGVRLPLPMGEEGPAACPGCGTGWRCRDGALHPADPS